MNNVCGRSLHSSPQSYPTSRWTRQQSWGNHGKILLRIRWKNVSRIQKKMLHHPSTTSQVVKSNSFRTNRFLFFYRYFDILSGDFVITHNEVNQIWQWRGGEYWKAASEQRPGNKVFHGFPLIFYITRQYAVRLYIKVCKYAVYCFHSMCHSFCAMKNGGVKAVTTSTLSLSPPGDMEKCLY